jgi:hypothetical protein
VASKFIEFILPLMVFLSSATSCSCSVGKSIIVGDIIKEIEIEKLKKITKLGQIDITFGDNR